MKGKKIARIGLAVLVGMLVFSSSNLDVFATTIRTTSKTQMQSDSENFYFNNYSDSDRHLNFNANWKFNLGDVKGAEAKIFDDAKWDIVSVPHDYSITQNYQSNLEAESGYLPGGIGWYRKYFTLSPEMKGKRIRIDFDGVYNNATVYVNGKEVGMHPYGYTPFSFDITDLVTKDGQENVVAVKVDHKTPSSRWYSGSGIYRDVTLTVTDPIYVALHGQKIEVPNLKENKETQVSMNLATDVSNTTNKDVKVKLNYTIYEANNEKEILAKYESNDVTTVNANSTANVKVIFNTDRPPKLWDTENPNLYIVKTDVIVDGKIVDTIYEDYGFRYFELDANNGAKLNGKAIKLKGVCLHHDQGALGSAAYHDAIERQVKIMKEMGVNSIRVTHNPASQALIDICNREGILLVEEIFDGWMNPKNDNSYDFSMWFDKKIEDSNSIIDKSQNMTWAEFEVKNTITRGQNEPSIIMFSLGNEIQEGTKKGGYKEKASQLIKWAQEADSDCLLTVGSNVMKNEGVNGEHTFIANELTKVGGAAGTNYSGGQSYTSMHNAHPDWKIYGSETASAVNSRGVYTTKGNGMPLNKPSSLDGNKQLTSYDKSTVPWGATANQAWYDVIKRDFVFGEYVWTGFDYIGEPTPANGVGGGAQGDWPAPKNSYFGIVDTAGFAKDSYYFYQSQWNDKVNTLHILPVWNRDSIMINDQGKVEVVVYSDADRVELWLNDGEADQKIATQDFETVTTPSGHTYKHKKGSNNNGNDLFSTFNVDYKEGTLYAKAYKKVGSEYQPIEKTEGRSSVSTTGEATQLVATQNRNEMVANDSDLVYIEVDVKDAKGHIVPNAQDRVTFKVEGEGTLVGVDNGSSPDHQSYKDDNRKAHAGKVLAIVKATNKAGNIKVTASADGLKDAVVNVKTIPSHTDTAITKTPLTYRISKNLYVKVENQPELPKDVEITYSDGSKERLNVTWDKISTDKVNKVGQFQVSGLATSKAKSKGIRITANINMISDIAALLNYSTTVKSGTKVKDFKLPAKRQAVVADGTILDSSFDVTWDAIPEGAFDKAGDKPVIVKGTATVFGQSKEVTASIRVQDVKYTEGVNIAPQASLEEIENNRPSDTLTAIVNGEKDFIAGGSPNPNVWTNYNNSQAGDDTATILFKYATQQTIGKIEVTFFRDNHSARFPDEDKIKFLADEEPLEIKHVTTTEKTTSGAGIATYTFEFDPLLVTHLKMLITNSSEKPSDTIKSCTGITEVEIKAANESFTTHTTADLSSLTLNGKEVSEDQLATGKMNTSAIIANITNVKAKDNASVTIIPAYNKVAKVITESEDGQTRKVFTIYLDNGYVPVNPDDKTSEIQSSDIEAVIAGNQHDEANKKENVIDTQNGTIWHTSWTTDVPKENLWIGFNFKEVKTIKGLTYVPRTDTNSNNGLITGYKVQYKTSDDDIWHDVELLDEDGKVLPEGTWANSKAKKVANFKEVKAKQIRLLALHSVGDKPDQFDKFASCAELRAIAPAPRIDLSQFNVEVDGMKDGVVIADYPINPFVTVNDGFKNLEYGIDYKLTYKNTDTFNKNAQIIIEGIGTYQGSQTVTFEMKRSEKVISQIAVQNGYKKFYVEGDIFDPTGLKFTVSSNHGVETVVYTKKNANEFKFTPGLDEALQVSDKYILVTYKGQTTQIEVTVSKPLVDKSQLEVIIKESEKVDTSKYTDETVKVFKNALTAAKSVLNDVNATQTTVRGAIENLKDARNQLKIKIEVNPVKVNKEKLQVLINKALTIKATGYTKESYQFLLDKISEANRIVKDDNALQTQVDAMIISLQSAIDNLEKQVESQKPITDDTTYISSVVITLGLSAIGGMLLLMHKKKNDNQ